MAHVQITIANRWRIIFSLLAVLQFTDGNVSDKVHEDLGHGVYNLK